MTRPLIPKLREIAHPYDGQAVEVHVAGGQPSLHSQPHAHLIVESWSPDKKNIAAAHIDRWHTLRDYSNERG